MSYLSIFFIAFSVTLVILTIFHLNKAYSLTSSMFLVDEWDKILKEQFGSDEGRNDYRQFMQGMTEFEDTVQGTVEILFSQHIDLIVMTNLLPYISEDSVQMTAIEMDVFDTKGNWLAYDLILPNEDELYPKDELINRVLNTIEYSLKVTATGSGRPNFAGLRCSNI